MNKGNVILYPKTKKPLVVAEENHIEVCSQYRAIPFESEFLLCFMKKDDKAYDYLTKRLIP